MFRSIVAAEKAAIAGEGHEEFDTQQCRDLQNEFLSVRICTASPLRHHIPGSH
jgi:hypothetical protein